VPFQLNLLSSRQTSRDENLEAKNPGGGGRVKGGTLCKGGSYAQFAGELIKIKWVIWREPPVHCMARLRLSRLSVVETGAARQLFCVGGSTVDSASPSRDLAG
jgi:hypothetical protein